MLFFTLILRSALFFTLTLGGSSPPSSSSSHLPAYAQRNLNTIRKIYNLTVYPHNVPIITHGAAAVPPGLFSPNATGRVSPVGNFSGFTDSIEYFFALAPTPQSQNGNAIYRADVVEFTSGCPDVAASVVYLRTGAVDPGTGKVDLKKGTSTLSQIAFWRFDHQGQVAQYHAWIPNLQLWTKIATGVDFGNLVVQKAAAASICPAIQENCKGPNQQYSNVVSCAAQLEVKPFGTFDEAWGDNIVCRTIHLILTKVRPEIHCPHVGPKGGNGPDNYKCVDIDYSRDYFDDARLFGAAEGNVFTCGGPLLS